jgi:hypothetical protein
VEGLVHMKQDVHQKLIFDRFFYLCRKEQHFACSIMFAEGTFISRIQRMLFCRGVGKTTTININADYVHICHLLVKGIYNLFKYC